MKTFDVLIPAQIITMDNERFCDTELCCFWDEAEDSYESICTLRRDGEKLKSDGWIYSRTKYCKKLTESQKKG